MERNKRVAAGILLLGLIGVCVWFARDPKAELKASPEAASNRVALHRVAEDEAKANVVAAAVGARTANLPSQFHQSAHEFAADPERTSELRALAKTATSIGDILELYHKGDESEDWVTLSLLENRMRGYEEQVRCEKQFPFAGTCDTEVDIVLEPGASITDPGVVRYVHANVRGEASPGCAEFLQCYAAAVWDGATDIPPIRGQHVALKVRASFGSTRLTREQLQSVLKSTRESLKTFREHEEQLINISPKSERDLFILRMNARTIALMQADVEYFEARLEALGVDG